MHGKKEDIPVVFEDGLTIDREAEWGNMNVAFEAFPAGTDTTPLFKELPNGACPSPHYGSMTNFKPAPMVSCGAHSKYQMRGETSDHLRLSVNGLQHATFSI